MTAVPAAVRDLQVRVERARRGCGMRRRWVCLGVAVGALVVTAQAQAGHREAVPVTPGGFRVDPAGREIGVSRLARGFQGPLGAALTPDGRFLLAASSGAARIDSADLFDLRRSVRSDAVYYDAEAGGGEAAFFGVAFSPDGGTAWVAGGGQQVVHVLHVAGGRATEQAQVAVPGFAAGLAYGVTPRGRRVYVALNTVPPFGANTPGHQVVSIDPVTRATRLIELGVAYQPLGVAFSRDGTKAFVTNWIGRSVSVIDTATETTTGTVTLHADPLRADHPSALAANPKRDEVYVADANSDTVSVLDARSNSVRATIPVGLVPYGPKGATPDGLAVSPDGRSLYVALAGENAVAVVDVARRAVAGFIPTSWYPADVEVTPDGRRLVITNRNDSGAGPNPCGPLTPRTDCPPFDPERDTTSREAIDPQYSGSMIKGSVQVVDVPRNHGRLRKLTRAVERNDQVAARSRHKPRALDAIKHVIYVIKENRTYDQVLGDLRRGNGDASLELFDSRSAPNHHALAQRFGLYDNFYADAEISADGHNWATQANASDYVEKTWPVNYSPRPRGAQRGYDFEDAPAYPTEPLPSDPAVFRPAAAQTVGYLWDNAWAHGVSYRSYGEYTTFVSGAGCPAVVYDSTTTHLPGHVAPEFPGYNLNCSDHRVRVPAWEREFRAFERDGNLPGLEIVRLPNDHTSGTTPGRATPEAYMADNDLALGRLVDVVSHSRYWKETVILVTEDDAQNGPDHVDAHRTLGYAISAYSKPGVDSTQYDTASMIATAEGLLGLPPMSINDARVAPMWNGFAERPDLRPYDALTPQMTPYDDPGYPTNPASAPLAAQSASWDFSKEDATPEIALNTAIWKSIRGRHAHMPAPRHEGIIGSEPDGD
jgi:YVTN family beta-propeller protein